MANNTDRIIQCFENGSDNLDFTLLIIVNKTAAMSKITDEK
jgi:hypothetical protein